MIITGNNNPRSLRGEKEETMKSATITVKKNEYGRIILSTHNGDWTVDEETANAIKELIDDCEWKEA